MSDAPQKIERPAAAIPADSNEQFSLLTLKKEIQEAIRQPNQSRIPLFIAALAALLSIFTLADNETDKLAMSAHVEASNKYAYFQAKSIRMTDARIAAKMFENMKLPKLAEYWQKKANRYNLEKFEIFKQARAQEKLRAGALARGEYFKVGVTLLQIAIVLASASMVVGGGSLFVISIFLTVVSIVYSLNGYWMFVSIPTSPGDFIDWVTSGIYRLGMMPVQPAM